ncbi:MAG: hypothetical protein ORN98_04695 [Alphaproteobacteria bacterium]|nr:hypothetical protein [Alphaproteobacteria bacterium]
MKSYRPLRLRYVLALSTAWLLSDFVPLDQLGGAQTRWAWPNLTKSAFAEGSSPPRDTPNYVEPPGTPSGTPSGTPNDSKNKTPKNNNRRVKYEYAQNNDSQYYFLFQPFYGFNHYKETVVGKPFMKENSEFLTGLSTEFLFDSTQFVANASFTYAFGTVTYTAYADDGSTYSSPGASISYVEPRASLGYYFPGFLPDYPELGVTPMIGLGWRYYRNDLRGKAYSPSEDAVYNGYRRTIAYLYAPLGLVFSSPRPLERDGSWSITFEYDAFFSGKVKSYSGDIYGCNEISPCRSGVYSNPIVNVQAIGSGYGLRTSGVFMYQNIGISPYFIDWYVDDSNKVSCGQASYCLEPKNQYYEYGLRLVLRY